MNGRCCRWYFGLEGIPTGEAQTVDRSIDIVGFDHDVIIAGGEHTVPERRALLGAARQCGNRPLIAAPTQKGFAMALAGIIQGQTYMGIAKQREAVIILIAVAIVESAATGFECDR